MSDGGRFTGLRIGLAGPMLGGNEGWVTSQHEILAERFASDGAEVFTTSSEPRRARRAIETVRSVRSWAGKVDVVLIAAFSGPAFWITDLTSIVARRAAIPQVIVLHGGNLPVYAGKHPGRVGRCLARADAVVAPSHYLAEEVTVGPDVPIVPNVFDVDGIPYRPRSDVQPKLLWMRTFHPIYNPLLALEVLSHVRDRHPGATLTMAGQDKGLRGECMRRASELGLEGAARFPGFLSEEAKREALESHDIFLNTNEVDNTPVSVLEAAAGGLPIIATAVGGLPHLFADDESALLRPAGDARSLAEAVLRVLDEPGLAARLGGAARKVAEGSSWSEVSRRWSDLFALMGVRPA